MRKRGEEKKRRMRKKRRRRWKKLFLFFSSFIQKGVHVRFRGMHRESEHVGCLRDVSSSEKAHSSINISHNGSFFGPACAPTGSTSRDNTEERAINGQNGGSIGTESGNLLR